MSSAQEVKVLLDGDEATVPLLDADAVVVVNSGAHGFYRVAYDDALRRTGGRRAQRELSTVERYSLVDDTWAAVVAGSTDAGAFCDLVANFSDEPDVAVWRTITAGLGWCDRLLEGEPRERFRAFVRQLVGPRLAELGWQAEPGEDDLVGELRGLLIRTMAVMGDDRATQERAAEVLDGHLRDGEAVDPPVVAAVVAVAAPGGVERYEQFVERFREADTPQDQLRYLYALADFDDEALMSRTLDFLLGPEVRTQNAPTCSPAASSTVTRRPGLAIRPRALGARQRRVPQRLDRSDGGSGQDAHPARATGRRGGLLRRARHPPGREDAPAGPRAPAGQRVRCASASPDAGRPLRSVRSIADPRVEVFAVEPSAAQLVVRAKYDGDTRCPSARGPHWSACARASAPRSSTGWTPTPRTPSRSTVVRPRRCARCLLLPGGSSAASPPCPTSTSARPASGGRPVCTCRPMLTAPIRSCACGPR